MEWASAAGQTHPVGGLDAILNGVLVQGLGAGEGARLYGEVVWRQGHQLALLVGGACRRVGLRRCRRRRLPSRSGGLIGGFRGRISRHRGWGIIAAWGRFSSWRGGRRLLSFPLALPAVLVVGQSAHPRRIAARLVGRLGRLGGASAHHQAADHWPAGELRQGIRGGRLSPANIDHVKIVTKSSNYGVEPSRGFVHYTRPSPNGCALRPVPADRLGICHDRDHRRL